MEQQEYFMKMQMMGQEAERLEQQMQAIEQQISELSSVKESLQEMVKGEQKEILANLGKGIFVKADIKEKNLFVNVGRNVIARKTPEETIKVIDEQTLKLAAGKEDVTERISELQATMQNLLLEMQKAQEKDSGHEHNHGQECFNPECECEEPCEECECEHSHEEKNGKKR